MCGMRLLIELLQHFKIEKKVSNDIFCFISLPVSRMEYQLRHKLWPKQSPSGINVGQFKILGLKNAAKQRGEYMYMKI